MRKIILYLAISIDGYLADEKGQVDWLNGQEDMEMFDSYGLFIKHVDTVIMGWNTYHQIVFELSPNNWPYANLKTYVITHHQQVSSESIIFTDENPIDLIRRIRHTEGKDIWICGGASLAQQLMQADIIDIYHFTIIPTLLGKGIRLFSYLPKEMKLKLIEQRSYNGIIEAKYERRK